MDQRSTETWNKKSPGRIAALMGCVWCITALMPAAMAAEWTGPQKNPGEFSGDYLDPENWLGDVLPGDTEAVLFNVSDTYEVRFDDKTTAGVTTVSAGDVTWLNAPGDDDVSHAVDGLEINGADLEVIDLTLSTDQPIAEVRGGGLLTTQESLLQIKSLHIGDGAVSGGQGRFNTSQIEANGLLRVDGPAFSETSAIFTGTDANFNGIGQVGTAANATAVVIVQSNADLSLAGNLNLGSQTGTGTMEVRTGADVDVRTTIGVSNIGSGSPTTGSGKLTIESAGDVRYRGRLNLNENGEAENLGGTLRLNAGLTVAGSFTQAGPASTSRTTISGSTTFESAASFTQTGGTVQFDAPTSFAIQDLSLNGASATDTATWDINEEVTWNRRLRVGDAAGTFARIDVGDLGIDARPAVLRNTGTGTQADLAIGYSGQGELNVLNGATVDVFDDLVIGQQASGQGKVTVGGAPTGTAFRSQLIVDRNGSGSNLFVGLNGLGELDVLSGGQVTVGNDLVVQAGSAGLASRVNVSGAFLPNGPFGGNPIVSLGGSLLIGTPGATPGDADVVVDVEGRPGSVALFSVGSNINNANRRVDIRPNGLLRIGPHSNFLAGSAPTTVQNGGELNVEADSFAAFFSLDVETGGKLDLSGGTLVAASLFSADPADFNWTGGTLTFSATDGPINNLGTGTLSPEGGLQPPSNFRLSIIDGDYHQGADASLEIEASINLSGDFSAYDRLAADTFTLDPGTTLLVDLAGNLPTPGQTIEIIQATNVVGTFDNLLINSQFTFEDALELSYTPTSVLLSVVAIDPPVGDYNDSGTVEQSDLNLVLNNWGQPAPFQPNGDPFVTPTVDQEELNRVLNNWGSSSAPSFVNAAVPEPTTIGLLVIAGLFTARAAVVPPTRFITNASRRSLPREPQTN